MELNREQKDKLKNKLISFCEELGGIIEDRGISLEIALESNYNNYGGLMFKIYKNYFGYETNKTRFITIFNVKDKQFKDSVYNHWKNNEYISYYSDAILDVLMNKDKILRIVKEKIKNNEELLNAILED